MKLTELEAAEVGHNLAFLRMLLVVYNLRAEGGEKNIALAAALEEAVRMTTAIEPSEKDFEDLLERKRSEKERFANGDKPASHQP